ncbi:MAG: hypothetical protein PHG95_02880 [Patescibacteria group bacterium]|nr:hypothetical protein [Patescibacteria group bacterium]
MTDYHFLPITLITLLIYVLSRLAVKYKKVSLFWQRRFCNYFLLLSFLVCAFSSLVLVMSIEYQWYLAAYRRILWLHVESGVVMLVLSIIHILWHLRYFFPRRTAVESKQ